MTFRVGSQAIFLLTTEFAALTCQRPWAALRKLITTAAYCSAKVNFALNTATQGEFVPLADADPYGDLIGAKYARAIDRLEPAKNGIQVTDLSFTIFDELVPDDRLEKLQFTDVIEYRKKSESAREAFLEYLVVLQAKQGEVGVDGDYAGTIRKLMVTEIIPAATKFKNELKTIGDNLFGKLAAGVVGAAGGAVLQVQSDLSLEKMLVLAAGVAVYVSKAGIEGILAERKARRDCSISYILSLDS
jgi:hypothetical protein